MSEFFCIVCLYVKPKEGLDGDDRAGLEVITVKSGLAVCLRHVSCVPDTGLIYHSAITTAIEMEAGRRMSLSAYQRQRSSPERPDDPRPTNSCGPRHP